MLLCALLTLGMASVMAETPADPFLWLENSDTALALQQQEATEKGTVEVLSYECPAYAINKVLGISDDAQLTTDTNGDGRVDIEDVNALINAMLAK